MSLSQIYPNHCLVWHSTVFYNSMFATLYNILTIVVNYELTCDVNVRSPKQHKKVEFLPLKIAWCHAFNVKTKPFQYLIMSSKFQKISKLSNTYHMGISQIVVHYLVLMYMLDSNNHYIAIKICALAGKRFSHGLASAINLPLSCNMFESKTYVKSYIVWYIVHNHLLMIRKLIPLYNLLLRSLYPYHLFLVFMTVETDPNSVELPLQNALLQ